MTKDNSYDLEMQIKTIKDELVARITELIDVVVQPSIALHNKDK